MKRDHLERAREAIRDASESATGVVHTQLDSIDEGIFEETDGERTQEEPGPKVDRIAEVTEKLDALQADAEHPETRTHIADALEHLRAYLKNHPQGG